MDNVDELRSNIGSKMVKADREMFGARASFVIGGNFNATFVVFKSCALNGWNGRVDLESFGFQFREHGHDCDYLTKGTAEGNIFGLCGTEGNELLTTRTPKDGAASIHDYVAGTRVSRKRIV